MRALAVEFLAEAKQRLGRQAAPLLAEARKHYQVVADRLCPLGERFTEANAKQNEEDIQDDRLRGEPAS